jgi:hypothetical protein
MAKYDEEYEQAIAKLLTEHLERGVPDDADVWAAVNKRVAQRETVSKGARERESRPWWRNVTEVILGSGAPKVESRPSERRRPLLAFSFGIVGLALLTLITVISIGRLAERGRNVNPGPIPTSSPAISTPIRAWSVIASSDFTDIAPLLIGNPSNGQRIKPFGSLAVGEDGNFWFLDGAQIIEFSADGATTIKEIVLDTRIRPAETTYLDSFNGLTLQGSNFWLLDGETVYKVAADGSLVETYQPVIPINQILAPQAVLPLRVLALRAGENGQMLIEQPDGTYVKADANASRDISKPQPTPFPGYPGGGKFYSYGSAPNEIMAGGVTVTVDVPGTINGRHILKVLPDGSFYVLVEAVAYLPNTVEGAYSYIMHYAADGKLIERARLFSPLGAQPAVWQVAFGPGGEFYAEASDLVFMGRVDLVRLIFRPASESLPAVPTTVPTPILPTRIPTIERPQVPSPLPSSAEQAPTIDPTPTVSALNTPTRVPGSPPISLARDGNGFRLDVYEGSAGFDAVNRAPWIDASRLLVAWYSTSETPTAVYSHATYMVDTTSGKLLTLPGNESNRDVFLSPDGNLAVMVSQNTLHVALYDFRSGALQTVADLDPSVAQWAGLDANLSEFKPGTEIFVNATPSWAGNDTFALTVQHSSGAGSAFGWDKSLLVNTAQHSVRVLANRGTVVATFPNGSVLVRSGRIDGEMQLFRPGDSSPITVAPSGLWTVSWSISPDGKQVAWFEMTPPASNGTQTPPVECCASQQPPALKDIAVFDSTTGNIRRFDVSGIAFISPGFLWTSGDNIKWGKDNSTLFYSAHAVKDQTTLYRLSLNGQATAIVDMDKLVGLDVVAEGNDGSIYYTIIGADCQTCVQLIGRHPDGTVEVVHPNGEAISWQVDGQGRLEEMKDGGILLTDLVTGQSHQVNFPGETIDTSKLGMALLGVGSLVPISPDGNWAAYAGSQSDAVMVGPDGRDTDRGRTVYIVRVK